jgi:hypothetical protein
MAFKTRIVFIGGAHLELDLEARHVAAHLFDPDDTDRVKHGAASFSVSEAGDEGSVTTWINPASVAYVQDSTEVKPFIDVI